MSKYFMKFNKIGGFVGKKLFIPEKIPKILKYNKKLYSVFPQAKNINRKKLKMTNISVYSMIKPKRAEFLSKIILEKVKSKDIIITDATANVGGSTINFASNFKKVNAIEIVPTHCNCLRNNLKVYNLLHKVDIYCKDYLDIMMNLKQDVVYFDPPWGGRDYKNSNKIDLFLSNINIIDIINKLYGKVKLVIMYMPRNYNIEKFRTQTKFKNVETKNLYRKDNKTIHSYLLVIS